MVGLFGQAIGPLSIDCYSLVGMKSTFNGEANLAIFNLPDYSSEHRDAIEYLYKQGFAGVILLLVGNVSQWAHYTQHANAPVDSNGTKGFNSFKMQLQFLEKPFTDDQLTGFVKRILTESGTRFRAHRRFESSIPAVICDFSSGTLPCTLKNISRGGACAEINPKKLNEFKSSSNVEIDKNVESAKTVQLAIDQLVQLNVDNVTTKGAKEIYNVWARVAWIKKERDLVGLEFLNPT